ncbi:uncharacterized protein [Ptychodera flava]|uniref:uncharacterized protein n=1 Tax=Ptychodera flava TaxID=63121 RepID=UPI003969E364
MALSMVQVVVLLAASFVAISSGAELCGLPGYVTTNLTQAAYWTFQNDTSGCFPDDKNAACHFYLAFCQSLTSAGQPFDETCNGAGACLIAVSNQTNTTHDIGEYDATLNRFVGRDDGSGFFHGYPNGEKLQCGEVHTLANFVCDLSVPWIPNQQKATPVPGPVTVNFINYENNTCLYNMTFRYAGACYAITPAQPTGGSGLSAGSILLIIFFTCVGLYFIIGCLVNRLQGHQGEELLPHHEFWCGLPGYIKDGMKYAWSVVTCKNVDGEAKGYDSI